MLVNSVRPPLSAPLPLLLALSGGCASSEVSPGLAPPIRSRQVDQSALRAPVSDELVELSVPGYEPAVVSVPLAGARRRPLLVAAHGAWDRPEPHCRLWRRMLGDRGFILCPRGKRTNRHVPRSMAAYYYPDHLALGREAVAAVRALAGRYPDQLDADAAVWAGFSQGAIQGALVIVMHPQMFPRAVLVEGGNGFFNEWSPFAARRYARAGGQRVLFGCGSIYCVRTAERCASYLERAGVEARVAHAQGAGHSYGAAMEARLSQHFDWVVADDPRWSHD